MGMTLAEKILAVKSGRKTVMPGDLVFAELDLVLGTDVTVPLGVKVFREMGVNKVHDPAKIVFVNDHFVPAKDIKSAELSQTMRSLPGSSLSSATSRSEDPGSVMSSSPSRGSSGPAT